MKTIPQILEEALTFFLIQTSKTKAFYLCELFQRSVHVIMLPWKLHTSCSDLHVNNKMLAACSKDRK